MSQRTVTGPDLDAAWLEMRLRLRTQRPDPRAPDRCRCCGEPVRDLCATCGRPVAVAPGVLRRRAP